MIFQNCSNIVLDNWLIRGADREERVPAAVLCFINCTNVRLKSLELSGGTLCRIEAHHSSVTMQNCLIHDCMSGGILLQDSDAQIQGLRIYDCHDSDETIVALAGGSTVLSNVQIYGNHTKMFALGLSGANVICKNVEVRQNVFAGLSDGEIGEGVEEKENIVIAAG